MTKVPLPAGPDEVPIYKPFNLGPADAWAEKYRRDPLAPTPEAPEPAASA